MGCGTFASGFVVGKHGRHLRVFSKSVVLAACRFLGQMVRVVLFTFHGCFQENRIREDSALSPDTYEQPLLCPVQHQELFLIAASGFSRCEVTESPLPRFFVFVKVVKCLRSFVLLTHVIPALN